MILRILVCAVLQFCIIGYVFGVMPTITRLNVQCDRTGMKVNVEFDNAFNGIIFSKGHYSDPSCRWVTASSSRRMFNFYIANSKCGTIGTDMARGSTSPQGFKNVIIIQNDPDYQDVWDSARKLSCDWVTRLEKYVTFAPFGVDMLGVKEMRFPGDAVDCWMDIQRGHGPFAPSVGGVVPIGEKLTVVIYVRDTDSSFDVHVKDCYAYDTADYRNPEARAIKLTDEKGCAVKEKLVQGFYRTRDVRTSGATIIAYGIINAFKFPERMDVFLACNVEVCKGSCPENSCQPEVAVAGEGEPGGMAGGSGSSSSTEGSGGSDMSSTTTAAPDGDGDGDDDDKEQEKDKDKEDESATTSSTTETPEGDGDEDEKETSGGSGTATEETESSEDTTSEKPKTDETKEEDEEKETTTKDEEEDKEEDKTNDVEDKDKEEKKDDADSEEKKKEGGGEDKEEEKKENGDGEEKKEEKKADDEEDEEEERRKKAARIRLNKKNDRKAKSSSSSRKSSAVIEPRKRSVKRLSRKNTTPKPKAASLKKREKELKKGTTKKPKKVKSKSGKSSNLAAASNNRARIIRAPSSIPAAFSRQVRELNSGSGALGATLLYQREGRHVRSRRSVAVAPEAENATFPAMMHSISIISPVEDFDEQELTAWEKMMTIEGKAEEVEAKMGLMEAISRMPISGNKDSYCFTMTSLLSSSILLATVVMVLSMSAAMTCLHLRTRPEGGGKEANLY